jgi:P-type Ca2+ transporter type 2C
MAQGQGREAQQVFSAWVATTEDVAKHHGVDVTTGLTASQVAEKRAQHGFNELEKEPGKSLFALVLEQFDDMLVKASPLARVYDVALVAVGPAGIHQKLIGWAHYSRGNYCRFSTGAVHC